jgi:hypothetical protein
MLTKSYPMVAQAAVLAYPHSAWLKAMSFAKRLRDIFRTPAVKIPTLAA